MPGSEASNPPCEHCFGKLASQPDIECVAGHSDTKCVTCEFGKGACLSIPKPLRGVAQYIWQEVAHQMNATEGITLNSCSSKQRGRYLSRLSEVIKCFKKMSEIVVDPANWKQSRQFGYPAMETGRS
ncbi:SET domain-containing protein 3 [Verticillium dahliae VDG1]|nr:SET domain-containing protein 3 [Verticillium dahliae VDG1]